MNQRKTNGKKYKIEDYKNKHIRHCTVLKADETSKNYRWICHCDCGNIFQVVPSELIKGQVCSCGCKKNNGSRHSNDEFYDTWYLMMGRCYNKNNCSYKTHGARGIKVCDEWHNPEIFMNWCHSTIGKKKKEYTIDRIDVNGNYCPENCRWATHKEQTRNKRNNRIEIIDGVPRTFTEWCEIYKIDPKIVYLRVNTLKWDFEKAIKTPHNTKRTRKIKIDNEEHTLYEWCIKQNISQTTYYNRKSNGMTDKEALGFISG